MLEMPFPPGALFIFLNWELKKRKWKKMVRKRTRVLQLQGSRGGIDVTRASRREKESAWERACRESRSIGSFPLLIRSVPRVHRYISVTFSNRPHFRPGYKQGSMADVAQGGSTRSVWSVCSIRLSCKFHNETNNTLLLFFFSPSVFWCYTAFKLQVLFLFC